MKTYTIKLTYEQLRTLFDVVNSGTEFEEERDADLAEVCSIVDNAWLNATPPKTREKSNGN